MRVFSVLIIFGLLSGCATPYQQAGLAGGFNESQLDINVWRISFQGNGYTRSERAEDYALLRSADLTLMNGFSFFALADSRSKQESSSYTAPLRATTSGNAFTSGGTTYGSATTRFSGGETTFISTPSAVNTVVMFKERPNLNGVTFDANFICQSLGKKYEITCGKVK